MLWFYLFFSVSGKCWLRWARGWAGARCRWVLSESGQQHHASVWDHRWARPGRPRRHSGGNQQSQREGNLQRSAHTKVDRSGSGFLHFRRRARWVGAAFCRQESAVRVWSGTSSLTVWILLPQARRWSWSDRWCWRCTRRKSRSFIKNWGARQPLTTRCLPNRAALPHHVSDLFQASAHPCKNKTKPNKQTKKPKTSLYILLILSQFVGVVQRKTNIRSHCKKAL